MMRFCIFYPTLVALSILAGAAGAVMDLQVEIDGDRFTLHARDVPLQDILGRMTDFGIRVRIDKNINPIVNASFVNADIQKGVDQILGSLNRVYIWKTVKGPRESIPRLAEIQVFYAGQRDAIEPLTEIDGFDIAYNPRDGTYFVKREILVGLRPGVTLLQLERLLQTIKGDIAASHSATGTYRIKVPENTDVADIVEKLRGTDGVAQAEPNYAYPISEPVTIESAERMSLSSSGKDPPSHPHAAAIAVLDSGLSSDAGLEALTLASLDAVNPDTVLGDTLGHGTQMALIASGTIDPLGVGGTETESTHPIIPIRSFDDNGFTSNFTLMESIDFAVDNGARVISLSWGTDYRSLFLENAMNYARSRGVIIVASAGNKPSGKPHYPAAFDSVIGVGALGPDGKPWANSNYGSSVTISAPGVAYLPIGYKGDPGAYAGTSIAAAYAANRIAAALTDNPETGIEDIMTHLKSSK